MICGARSGVEQRRPQMRAGEEDVKRVANCARHRHVAGDHQIEWQSGDLDVAQRRIQLRARRDQRADQILGRLACAFSDGFKEIMLQRDRAFGVGNSLSQRPGLLHQKPVVAPVMQLREVFPGQAEKFAENPQRQRPREGADQVGFPFWRKRAEEFVDDTANRRLERGNPAWRERLGGQTADPVMQRWVDLDDVGHVAVAFREHRGHRIRQWCRLQRAARRKPLVILEDGEDVVITGDHPQIESGRVEYRLLAPRRGQNGKWMLPLLWRERIEARRKRRRACCRLHRGPGLWPRFAVFSPRGKPGSLRHRALDLIPVELARPIEPGFAMSGHPPKIKEHRGNIIKTTGDGMLVEFASAIDAVRCAVGVQFHAEQRRRSLGSLDCSAFAAQPGLLGRSGSRL